ncbi:hypothetical protein DPSP01_013284 [Paraphaeosphaeria sporulosa]
MQPIDAGKRAGILAGDRGLRGVLTLQSFVTSFRVRYSPQDSRQQPSLQQLGAFLACFVAWPVTNRYGRHKTLALASAIFVVGADIQTIDTHAMGAFYPGRVIAGVGLGAATVVNLIYSSEMTAKHLRGQIGSLFQSNSTIGISMSYLVDYDLFKGISAQGVNAMADPHRPADRPRCAPWS